MRYRTSDALLLALAAALLTIAGCERDTAGLGPAPFNTDPVVFQDEFIGIDFAAFAGSKLDALDIDTEEGYRSDASIKISVPDQGDPSGGYAGGAITSNAPRDLSQYNAVTFWAKASRSALLDGAGYGNDNTGTSKYMGGVSGIPLKTYWQRYILPIPRTGKLVPERGLFFFAEADQVGEGYDVWFDEVEFTNVANISNPRPIMRQGDVSAIAGVPLAVEGTSTALDVSGVTVIVTHQAGYFTLESSNEDVAIPGEGVIHVVGGGTAEITAKLDTVIVAGRFTINALDPPSDAAPRPTIPAADVISIFSNVYTNRPVDSFSPEWDTADVSDLKIAGDDVKVYNIPTQLDVAVIEFATQLIDATNMTHIHIDIWVPQGTATTPFFGLGLFSFGPDGVFSGGNPPPAGDDSQWVVAIVQPELVFGEWLSLDIPLADFTVPGGLEETAHLAQIILRSDAVQLIVDNIFFYNDGN
ncbi:MAG: hypothetical protein OEN01_05365 [Candidatus Krumholzibacteria bacterium]|nr:hypothetical protein [Candidatus Krumholzibacteria bacterium]